MAAGDDISLQTVALPSRTGLPDFRELAFGANYEIIDGVGRSPGYSDPKQIVGFGAVLCWRRCVLQIFRLCRRTQGRRLSALYRFRLGWHYVKLPEVILRYRIDGHSFGFGSRHRP